MTRRLSQVVALLLIFVVGKIMLDHFVRQMLYPAPAVPIGSQPPETLEDVFIETEAGDTIHGWYAAESAADGSPEQPAPTLGLLFLHGNGG